MNEQTQSLEGAPLFNPLSPDFIADPYPFYHRLRAIDPMHLSPRGFHVASRHADIISILRDKRFGKDFVGRMTRRYGPQILEEPVYRSMSRWMLDPDPPDHGRLRGLVVGAFTAQRVEDMRPRIQQIVDKIIGRVEPRGHMNLIADFAFRLPVTVICEMLGIPDEYLEPFLTSSRMAADGCSTLHRSPRTKSINTMPSISHRRSISAACSSCAGANRDLPESGSARYHTYQHTPAVVRRRNSLLPGRTARSHRRRDCDRDVVAPLA